MADKLPLGEFAAKIKAKYPEYQSVNDTLLVEKMLAKYPEYADKVEWPIKKKDDFTPDSSNGAEISGEPSEASPQGEPSLTNYGSSITHPGTFGDIASNAAAGLSAEPQGYAPVPTPDIEGTFREGFEGNWFYDADGYETYAPTQEVIEGVGGIENLKEFIRRDHPNVILTEPSGRSHDFGAKPVNLDQLQFERDIQSIDPSLLSEEDASAVSFALAINNLSKADPIVSRTLSSDEQKMQSAERRGGGLGESDEDRWWATKYIATPLANVGSAVGREGARLISGALGIPEYANDVIAGAINSGIELLGGDPETIPNWGETFGETPVDRMRNYLNAAVERNVAKNAARYGDDDIWDTLKSGNIDAAANKIADGLGGMVPFMTLLASTGGAGLMLGTGSLAADRYSELQESDAEGPQTMIDGYQSQDMPGYIKLINATINGAAETGLEAIGNKVLLEPLQAAVKNMGRERGRGVVQSTIEKALRKYLGPIYPLAPPVIETVTELATTLTDNIVARATGEDPDRRLNEGFMDTAILSLAMSGGVQTASSTLNTISNKKNLKQARDILAVNRDIESAISSEQLTEEELAGLNERYRENIQTINDYVENDLNRRGNLSAPQQAVINELEAMKGRQESLLESERIPDSVKQSAQSEIDSINDRIEGVIEEETETRGEAKTRTSDRIRELEAQESLTPEEQLELADSRAEFRELNRIPDLDDLPQSVQNEVLPKQERIQEITSELNQSRRERTLTAETESRLVQERRRLMDEINAAYDSLPAQPQEMVAEETVEAETEPVTETTVEQQAETPIQEETIVAEPVEETREQDAVEDQLDTDGQPTADPAEAVQVSDETSPRRASQTYQDSFDRLTEGMTPEQIDADPDLVRLRDRAQQLRDSEQTTTFAEQTSENETNIQDRSSQEELRSRDERAVRTAETTSGLKSHIAENEAKLEGSDPEIIDDSEKRSTLSYAKENNLWLSLDEAFSLGEDASISGNENQVLVNESEQTVYKINNLFNSNNSVSTLIDGVEAHNELFPETRYDVVGFTGTEGNNRRTPTIQPILRQDLVDGAIQATPKEISDYMESRGFTKIDDTTFENEDYIVSDLRPRNVLKGTDGGIYVIDDIIRLKQQEETQDGTISQRTSEEIPLEPAPRNRESLDQEVREQATAEQATEERQPQEQIDEVIESTEQEAPAKKPAKKPSKKAPSIKDILTDADARQSRMEELRARINSRPPQWLGIASDSRAEAAYWRDVTDYAIIRLVDGAITTAQQLANELGIPNSRRLRDSFNYAKAFVESDNELAATTARNVDTAAKREAYGFDQRVPLNQEPTQQVIDDARKAIEDGYDVYGLMSRIQGGEKIGASSLETAILAQFAAANEAKVIRENDEMERTKGSSYQTFMVHSDAKDRAINNLMMAYDALELSGTANARALNIRKALAIRDFSLASMIAERRKAIGGDTVGPEQMREVEREYRRILKVNDQIRARNEQLELENSKLDAENRILKLNQDTAESRRKRASKPRSERVSDINERRKAAVEDILAVWSEWTSPGFAKTPENQAKSDVKLAKALLSLAQTYIEEGIVNATDIIDRMYDNLKVRMPNVSKKQLMDAIAGSQPDTRPTLEDIRRQLRDFRIEVNLLRDIDNAEKGIKKYNPNTREYRVRNSRLQELRDRLKTLQESQIDPEVKRERDLAKTRANIESRIKDLQRKIRDKDFSKPDKQLILDDPELKRLRRELNRLQFDFRVENKKYELARRNKAKKFLDGAINVLGVPRAIMATADLSAPLRQGVFVVASRPFMTARATLEMFRYWNSKTHYDDFMADFRNSDGYDLAIKSGLSISDQAANVQAAAREEDFMSNLVNKVPLFGETLNIKTKVAGREFQIGDLHGRSERAYVGFLNKMRIDLFHHGVQLLQNDGVNPTDNPSAYNSLARYVNAATGRGPMPDSLKTAGAALSTVFFAPRLVTSRLYLMAGGPVYGAPKAVRNMYLRDLGSFIGFGMSVLSAFALMGADVEDDPRSADFGKIRFGDDRYDIWGGFTQYVTLIARELTGERVTTAGKVRKIDGTEYDRMTRLDVIGRFARSKLAPTTALTVSALDGKNYMGEPFDLANELKNMSMPLVLQDISEAIGDKPAWQIGLGGAAMMFGVGFQSYRANNFLDKGVDDRLIDLLNDKKAVAMEPHEQTAKVYDMDSGEETKMSGEEFKRYSSIWSDYIKKDLESNYSKYKDMSADRFDKQFTVVKSKATRYAKEEISGVSSYDLTIQDSGKRYKLTPDQVQERIKLMDEYKKRYAHRVYRERDKLVRRGMSPDMALIEAKKELDSDARADSKNKLLRMNRYKQIELVEDN